MSAKKEVKVIEDRVQVENKLRSGIYMGKNPLPEHQNKFKLNLYSVINPVYEGKRIIDEYFYCTRCLALLHYNINQNGTNQIKRHFENKNNQCLPNAEQRTLPHILLNRQCLAKALADVCVISSMIAPLTHEELLTIIQSNFNESKLMLVYKIF